MGREKPRQIYSTTFWLRLILKNRRRSKLRSHPRPARFGTCASTIFICPTCSLGEPLAVSLFLILFFHRSDHIISLSLFLCRTWTRCSRFLDAPAFRQNMRPVETTLYNIMADTYRYAFLSDKSRTSRGNVRNFGANARSSRRGSSMVATRPRADLYLLVNVYVSCIFISSEILICNCSFSKTRNRYL